MERNIIKELPITKEERSYLNGLKKGREEAWKVASRIVLDSDNCGKNELKEYFDNEWVKNILIENSADEAFTHIKEYIKQKLEQGKIHIGDEVINQSTGRKGIVISDIYYPGSDMHCMELSNIAYVDVFDISDVNMVETRNLKKSGHHFDIEGILKAMRDE